MIAVGVGLKDENFEHPTNRPNSPDIREVPKPKLISIRGQHRTLF